MRITETCRPTRVKPIPNSTASDGTSTSPRATDTSDTSLIARAGTQPTITGHRRADSHSRAVGDGSNSGTYQPAIDQTKPTPSSLVDTFLNLAAEVLNDTEKVWVANQNRLDVMTRHGVDKDGEQRGWGLAEDHPDVKPLVELVQVMENLTVEATKTLEMRMRRHPLGPWVKAQRGIGDKQAARLLAAIGDPYWNTLHDRPRTVSELWAYCGYHVVMTSGGGNGHGPFVTQAGYVGTAPRRTRGQKSNWSDDAKKRAWLIADSCVKQLNKTCPVDEELRHAVHIDGCGCSPYRVLYDLTKAKYAGATHQFECVRCGPPKNPAPAGTPLNQGHIEARARRAMAKAILKDLWIEARRLHELPTHDQLEGETQIGAVVGRDQQ